MAGSPSPVDRRRRLSTGGGDETRSQPTGTPCDRAAVPQPVLLSDRLVMAPLAPEHLDLEAQLDFDAEVMRHIGGAARSMVEVERGSRTIPVSPTSDTDWPVRHGDGGTHARLSPLCSITASPPLAWSGSLRRRASTTPGPAGCSKRPDCDTCEPSDRWPTKAMARATSSTRSPGETGSRCCRQSHRSEEVGDTQADRDRDGRRCIRRLG